MPISDLFSLPLSNQFTCDIQFQCRRCCHCLFYRQPPSLLSYKRLHTVPKIIWIFARKRACHGWRGINCILSGIVVQIYLNQKYMPFHMLQMWQARIQRELNSDLDPDLHCTNNCTIVLKQKTPKVLHNILVHIQYTATLLCIHLVYLLFSYALINSYNTFPGDNLNILTFF